MKKQLISLLLLLGATAPLSAQADYTPTEENVKARQEFQEVIELIID